MDIAASLIKLIFGSKADKDRKQIEPYLEKIKAVYPAIEALSNDELRARSEALKKQIADFIAADEARIVELKAKLELAETSLEEKEKVSKEIDETTKRIDEKIEEKLDEILPEAFAIMKDTARRFAQNETVVVTANDFDRDLAAAKDFVTIEGDKAVYANHWMAGGNDVKWDMIHYDVQLFGGVVLHKGKIAEMATGEGKTLVATLPVFLNALAKKGVHLVTVNNYLAKRDSEWMGPMYQFHGLSVACIDDTQPNSDARRKAYMADITFGTNNEYGFDYLRDNMASSPADLVQRKHHFAIVDEVDSVLIDDARTPLIISGPVPKGDDQMFEQYRPAIDHLYNLQKNLVTGLLAEARQLIAEGKNDEGGVKLYRAHKGLPKYKPLIKYLSETGVKALMQKTENTYMQDNNRRMPEITDDLFFVIDEKLNSVELTDKGHEVLSKYFNEDGFFVMPDIGAEVAELEKSDLSAEERARKRDEVINDYSIKSERVHTVHQLLKAYAMFEKDVEYVVMDNKVKIVDEQTGRILDGRRYSDGLHQAIEAKEHVKVEAATQTFATITLQNYFRMYHKLAGMTGTAETEAGELWDIYKLDVVTIPTNRPVARIDMDDRVYKTKKEKYAAVIEEIVRLREAGRPVLVGTTSVEISELLKRMLDMRHIESQVLNAKLHQKEAQVVALAGRAGTVTIATNMAGRGTDIKLTPEVKEAGGLAIIGTERHESRRVDRQLRGRSGRQGDPGSSVFYVSFEDQLMRLFATDRVMKMLDTLGLKEGEMIESKMVTRAIENAQKRVEENNFGVRKRLLEYDDVMNKQRTYIYNRRHHALLGERIGIDIANMIYDLIENLVVNYDQATDYEELSLELMRVLTIEPPFTEKEFASLNREEKIDRLYAAANENLDRRSQRIIEIATPVIKEWVENRGATGNILVPMTDGKRVFNLRADINEAYNTGCKSIVKEWHKAILLVTIDELWKEHLRELDDLRQSVQNASYEQKDPLVIYKVESFHIFEAMLNNLNQKALAALMRGQIYIPRPQPQPMPSNVSVSGQGAPAPAPQAPAPEVRKAMPERPNDYSQYTASKEGLPGEDANRQAMANAGGGPRKVQPAKAAPKVGRNDPCPCGSGKKFKNCHGRGL